MIVKKKGGMTEFIPSPQEKREGLIRDHVFDLLTNIHNRLERLEQHFGNAQKEGQKFHLLMRDMRADEIQNEQINLLLSKVLEK